MKTKPQRPAGSDKSPITAEIPLACADETAAVEFLEKQRWDGKPTCPHCSTDKVLQLRETT